MASSEKWFLGFVIVALAASAFGQNTAIPAHATFAVPPPIPDSIAIDDKSYCPVKLKFRGHVMLLKDIFPEECDETLLPPDVPAIAESYLAHHKGDPCYSTVAMACIYHEDEYEKRFTCADKSRIVMTAENGDNWCHKPQTDINRRRGD